jgi:ABC-type glycerol-3-phosphate transport system substrate-binding protein
MPRKNGTSLISYVCVERMTLARATRLLLAFISVMIVVWAFFDVGRRTFARWRIEHERPVTLSILHWGDTAEADIVEKLVRRYETDNPHVRIIRIHTPGGSGELKNKLKTMLAAGAPPDLFYLPADELAGLATMELITPIDSYLEKERAAGTGAWIDDIYPILLEAWHYDVATQQVGKGKLYGLPKDFTTAGFYVNLDLFAKAGVKVPYDGWTWDEFESSMKKITALNGKPGYAGRRIYGGYFNLWSDSLRNIVWSYGGEFFRTRSDGTADFHDVTLDEPAAQEALQMIVRRSSSMATSAASAPSGAGWCRGSRRSPPSAGITCRSPARQNSFRSRRCITSPGRWPRRPSTRRKRTS